MMNTDTKQLSEQVKQNEECCGLMMNTDTKQPTAQQAAQQQVVV